MEVNTCTRCGKKLGDLKITISQNFKTARLKESGQWENLPNLDVNSYETLCKECFDEYAHLLSQMNK